MLYREIIAVCSQIHTKHINTLCGQNVPLLNVNPPVYQQLNTLFCMHQSGPRKCLDVKIYKQHDGNLLSKYQYFTAAV